MVRLTKLAASAFRIARRFGLGVADQALSSLSNFAIGIVIIRLLGAEALGVFMLAFTTYIIALNISRGLATDPLVVRFGDKDSSVWQRATAASTGTALVVGALIGAACFLPAVLAMRALDPDLVAALAALGVSLPGLLVQDSWRYAFFAKGRADLAFLNDLVWVVVQALIFTVLISVGVLWVASFVLVWGGAASVAAIVGARQACVLPRPLLLRSWFRNHRDLGARYMVENLSVSLDVQLRAYGTGAIAGLQTVGVLRATELLFGPLTVFHFGVELIALPEAVKLRRDSLRRLWAMCVFLGMSLALLTILWTIVVMFTPQSVGAAVLGSSWLVIEPLVLPMGFWTTMCGLTAGATVGLRALAAARRSLRVRLISSGTRCGASLAGVVVAGAVGGAWGLAAASVFSTALWWWELCRALREQAKRNGQIEGPKNAPPDCDGSGG